MNTHIIGGGIIGLEMATVYASLGAQVDVVEMLDGVMAGADRDMVKVWQKYNEKRLGRLMVKTRTTAAKATSKGIEVSFEGENAPEGPQVYDLVLSAVGRTPNGKKLDAEKAGVAVGERGFIEVDTQLRTNVPHIFAIGDIVGQPMPQGRARGPRGCRGRCRPEAPLRRPRHSGRGLHRSGSGLGGHHRG